MSAPDNKRPCASIASIIDFTSLCYITLPSSGCRRQFISLWANLIRHIELKLELIKICVSSDRYISFFLRKLYKASFNSKLAFLHEIRRRVKIYQQRRLLTGLACRRRHFTSRSCCCCFLSFRRFLLLLLLFFDRMQQAEKDPAAVQPYVSFTQRRV